MMKDQCGRFWNGMDLLKDVTENKHFLPTGLEGIDTLLGGGLRQGQVTEITGPSSSGKTQVCLHSASYVAARHMGAVMYLDTSNSFSPSRIANITDELPISLVQEPRHVRLKRAMSSIICESVFDIFALFEVLHRLELSLLNDKVNNVGSKVCLLIIDSISSLLAPIIGGKYLQGRSMMISMAMILKKLADEHNLSVLVTNHMVSAGNGALKPALGESWKAVPHVRLVIFRDHGSNICTATVLKHTLMASGRPMKFVVPS
ncbi:DNA repair protein RAD51 homolog 4 isoform X3 [Phragmites australis]|nr:DNA repair protein RAD51 homolog 4 isoform X3 [Phragmites australis]XP_062193685.1 DNA repair protein RAD51 homolog 4 isoform X3 [Phragmites australis]XP_062193686.1 DNA repair protein RAD51 homolog 4 isoform X3 [Phragmites australis]